MQAPSIQVMERRHRLGRPADPRSPRLDVALDSTVKRCVVRLAVRQGLSLNDLVETALRQYLTRYRANGTLERLLPPARRRQRARAAATRTRA